MGVGFFIAKKLKDGSPGQPIGMAIDNIAMEGGIMMFEELGDAIKVRDTMQTDIGPLSIFKVNLVFAGEVLL